MADDPFEKVRIEPRSVVIYMPLQDERASCQRCRWSFRCPLAQRGRFFCRACEDKPC